MIHLLVLREHLKNIYQKYSRFLDSLFRFVAGLLTFLAANEVIGYNPALNHWYIVLILAVFGIVMPGGALVVAAAVFVVAHIFYVSPVLALVVGTVFVILYYVYIKFVPEHAYIFLAFFIAFPFHMAYAIPIFLGLIMGPIAVVPIICSVSMYYLLQTVVTVVSTSTDTNINLYHVALQQFLDNKEMYVMILVFCVVAVTVNVIRSKEMDYAFEIAILTGGILNVILLLLTNYFVKIDTKMFALLAGTALSVVLVWMIQFMRLALNYAGVENLQFEDDEYYYYVRAVPKMSVAAPNKRVKRFNTVDRETDTDTEKTEPVEEDFDEDIIFPEKHDEK